MFSLFNPWVIICLGLMLGGVYGFGHHNGYVQKETEDKIQIAKLNDQARQTEQEAAQKVSDISTKLVKANQNAKAEITKRDAAIASGELRLSIATRSAVYPSRDAASASGDSHETRAELDPAAAQSLVAITDQGDANTRQLNACIDAYEKVREQLHGKR